MELRHLRYFVKVASELHFGRAAEALGISQPPLSQQIRLLEQELGVQLFERSSRKVRLTVAGRLFLGEARATLAQADHAADVARRSAIGEIGELAIGISASTLFVPAVSRTIARFHAQFPNVRLRFIERSITAQREAVANGALDLGFVRGRERPLMPDAIEARCLGRDRMLVLLPRSHPLAQDDAPVAAAALAGEAMVHYPYDREGFLEDLYALFRQAGFRPRVVHEAQEMSTLLGLVAAGLGISVLPGSLARLTVDTLCSRELADEEAVSAMWLLHRPDRASPAMRHFMDLLEEVRG